MLASLATASAVRHEGAASHFIRTAVIAECLARLMGLHERDQEKIRLATPVHDVGKLAIADAVLLKPGQLSAREKAVMGRHSDIGADILSGDDDELLQFAARMARSHHERYDGTGYPQGLSGDDLPLAVRIVAVADIRRDDGGTVLQARDARRGCMRFSCRWQRQENSMPLSSPRFCPDITASGKLA